MVVSDAPIESGLANTREEGKQFAASQGVQSSFPAEKPLSLLMTADTLGGVWTYALELIRALRPHGVQVHLASMGRLPSGAQQKDAAALPNLLLHPGEFKLEWMEDPWQEVAAAGEWLLALEKELKPDLIHLNTYCHGQLPWQAPVLMVGHSCVRSWWKAVKDEEAPETYAAYTRNVQAGLQAAALVVAPTQAYLQELQYYYGPFQQETVIPNGRDCAHFRPQPKEPFIFSAGRLWDEAKNLMACEGAAAALSWPIELAGDVQHPAGGQPGQFEHLQLLGQLSQQQVAEKMARAAIYLMPAKYEPFGLSILEAAFSGCALVLGDIPSLRENWEGAALFVDPNSPGDIEEKLVQLCENTPERERMGALARQKAAAFNPHCQAEAYLKMYQELIKDKLKKGAQTKSANAGTSIDLQATVAGGAQG